MKLISKTVSTEFIIGSPLRWYFENETLKKDVARIFAGHKYQYGYKRIAIVLRNKGKTVSMRRVLNAMRDLGIITKGCNYRHKRRVQSAAGREHPSRGLIVYMDRGSQFAGTFQNLMHKHGFQSSVNRKGNPFILKPLVG